MRKTLWSLILATTALLCAVSCSNHSANRDSANDGALPDTLVVGTLYSPTSFFLFRGDTMGYDYDRICSFARAHHLHTKFVIGSNLQSLIEQLNSGAIDVIAYEVPITNEYKRQVLNCGSENITYQVLVQPKSDSIINNVIQLIGKDVYVEKDSKYEARIRNLDEEIGGGIRIHTINEDTISAEDLIEKVATGKIPLTVVNSDIAQLNHTYYNNIDISLQVSFRQRASWAVSNGNTALADSINSWSESAETGFADKEMLRRYFEMSKTGFSMSSVNDSKVIASIQHGIISHYDALFKSHAKTNALDWRMLAAIGWVESQFNPNVVSWAGARGIMQLMPRTARAYGLPLNQIEDPDKNIATAAKSIAHLDAMLKRKVPNSHERQKFVWASYNAGIGHILDAIALARKYCKNPHVWNGNVAEALLLKSNPVYYNDSICHSGYFRGRQTVSYVNNVNHYYNLYCSKIKK